MPTLLQVLQSKQQDYQEPYIDNYTIWWSVCVHFLTC